ncbi:MAG: hypothetical protein Q4D38_08360, partial [Planctomycetia bacterium]|nr:hypothetical protein [Planctomycetia bacterium]
MRTSIILFGKISFKTLIVIFYLVHAPAQLWKRGIFGEQECSPSTEKGDLIWNYGLCPSFSAPGNWFLFGFV